MSLGWSSLAQRPATTLSERPSGVSTKHDGNGGSGALPARLLTARVYPIVRASRDQLGLLSRVEDASFRRESAPGEAPHMRDEHISVFSDRHASCHRSTGMT